MWAFIPTTSFDFLLFTFNLIIYILGANLETRIKK
jgi:hypothetical protein